MISWRNPTRPTAISRFDDYRKLGVEAALDTIGTYRARPPGPCAGLLPWRHAAVDRRRHHGARRRRPAEVVTLLAAQTDFTEAGELTLFINESQVAFLEDMMWERGVLDTTQMAGAFQLLRSNDLIWSRLTRDYLMGERAAPSDLMAWNADATRLPYRMHSEYLRKLFLNNDLAEGRYLVEGKPISLSDIRTPMFVVGTAARSRRAVEVGLQDPLPGDADVTFVLTSGGHNAGIVAPPGEPGHTYRIKTEVGARHLYRSRRMAEDGATGRGIVVAGMDEVAGRAIR